MVFAVSSSWQQPPRTSGSWRTGTDAKPEAKVALGREVRWQNARAEPNPPAPGGLAVAHPGLAHGHRPDPGHDLALGQMPVAHDALAARLGLEIGVSPEEVGDLRLDGLREQGTCPVAQNLGERIGESPWLSELDHVSVGHGVSLLQWTSGGVEHPHDTPPYPFMPSPTSEHSSPFSQSPIPDVFPVTVPDALASKISFVVGSARSGVENSGGPGVH